MGVDDQIGIDRRAEVDLHAEPLHLVGEEAGDRFEVRSVRGARRHLDLTTEEPRHLVELHVVTPQRRRPGRLETGRTAADDEHLLRHRSRGRRLERHCRLVARRPR